MDNTTEITTPLVSILMLTYNRATYLKEAIESVQKQTYQNWELIVIDDGSTDTTSTIVAQSNEPRIRYIRHEQNEGLFVRRAESLSYTHGTYTAILDSDDLWHAPDKLSKQVDFMERHPDCVLLGTFANLIDANGTQQGSIHFATDDHSIRQKIAFRNQFIHSSVLMRTALLQQTQGYQPTLAEDLELYLQLGRIGTFANLPENLTSHRVHAESENDHGRTIRKAVLEIIQKHTEYPHAHAALMVHRLRLLLGI